MLISSKYDKICTEQGEVRSQQAAISERDHNFSHLVGDGVLADVMVELNGQTAILELNPVLQDKILENLYKNIIFHSFYIY